MRRAQSLPSSSSCSSSSKAGAVRNCRAPTSNSSFICSWMWSSSSASNAISASSRRSGLIPNANAARAPTFKVPPWVAATLRALGASIVVLVLAQYLAGFFFLWLSHLSLSSAGPLTVARYAHYYGDRADIRHRVWIASGLGVVLAGLCALPIILPRRRALHG